MDRLQLVDRGERFVRAHRFTIAVVFPLVGGFVLIASAASVLPPPLAYNPLLLVFGTLVMRLPLLVAIGPLVDRRVGGMLLALAAFTYGIELVGVTTGWPYGQFVYLQDLGPMLFDRVPLALPLFFLPLVLNAYLLCLLLLGSAARRRSLRLVATLGFVLLIDLVLDPGAVTIGFWAYDAPGRYYGVPTSNYAGWVLSGSVVVLSLDSVLDRTHLRERLRECEFALDDLASFVIFWGVINVYGANWIPVALAGVLLAALLRATGTGRGVVGRASKLAGAD